MIERDRYDQIVSLGRACQPAYQLRRLTGVKSAHVLDWIITPDEGLIRWIETDLDGFFARDRLVADRNGVVIDAPTETQFIHEFPPEADFEAAYAENVGRYAMLVGRWRELMASDQRVLFVRQHGWNNDARTMALRVRETIAKCAPKLRFDLLYLTPDEQGDWREPGITNRYLRQTEPYEWQGDNDAWSDVLGYPPPAAPMLGVRHVFVCGLHRSGTSALHDILKAHPEVTGFIATGAPRDEGQHLQSIIETDADLGGPGAFGVHERARLTEVDVPHYASRLNTVRAQWAARWDEQRSIRVEKSPPNILRTRFLQETMPDARFVFIVRHPIAVALATVKWMKSKSVEEAFRHWFAVHHAMLEDARKLKRSVCLRYEDLAADPNSALARVWPIIDAEAIAVDASAFEDHNAKYLTRAFRFELSKADHRLLAHFGYRLGPPFVDADRTFGW